MGVKVHGKAFQLSIGKILRARGVERRSLLGKFQDSRDELSEFGQHPFPSFIPDMSDDPFVISFENQYHERAFLLGNTKPMLIRFRPVFRKKEGFDFRKSSRFVDQVRRIFLESTILGFPHFIGNAFVQPLHLPFVSRIHRLPEGGAQFPVARRSLFEERLMNPPQNVFDGRLNPFRTTEPQVIVPVDGLHIVLYFRGSVIGNVRSHLVHVQSHVGRKP